MNILTSWIKNIIYYILFIKLATTLIPKGSMEKYIKLFSGILLIYILVTPLLFIKNNGNSLKNQLLKYETFIFKEDFATYNKLYNNVNNNLAINLYKKRIEENIKIIIGNEGMELSHLEIKIEDREENSFGEIREINIKIKENSSSNTLEEIIIIKEIKKEILSIYKIPVDNIKIEIYGG